MQMISVIVPCYNAAFYLEECLRSVLSQEECVLEVLVVDDGSTDGTAEICDAIAAKDVRVRVWHSTNRGVSAARNLALDEARGEWVTFVDADDVLPRGALARMLMATDETTDAVIAAHEEFYQDGTRKTFAPERFFDPRRTQSARDIVARRLIQGDSVYNIMCSKLHRRAHLSARNIRLCEDVRIGEDALFNFEALYTARKFVYVEDVCYSYRIHALSAMQQSEGKDFARMRPFFGALGALLKQMGIYKRYFAALADSVTLRLYKESGLGGVVRRFDQDARPFLDTDGLHSVIPFCVRTGIYPFLYVLVFPCAALRRRIRALLRRSRHG